MIKYPKTVIHDGIEFGGKLERRSNRRGKRFIVLIYRNRFVNYDGWIYIGEGWQDMDRTVTAQDIYWEDKVDCKLRQREAA
ncbi:hypothetical protein LCGC14_2531620 [marine sediment metagenome]|uniref:Uncharacterized protein n=1 Tax=marine sediment metagenome TaxID=412755 RepID=A0A0F9DLM1_9ZZZZ